MNRKPKLLFLVHRFPYPPNRGDRIRSFHILKFLSERYDVFLGSLWDEKPTAAEMKVVEDLCREVAARPVNRVGRWVNGALTLASGKSATEGLFYSAKLQKVTDQWIENEDFDAILVFCSSMFQYVASQAETRIPLVVDLVDVDSQKWFDYADRAKGTKRRLFLLEGHRLRKLENKIHRHSAAVTLVSAAEADLFRQISSGSGSHAVGNGVDMEYFQPPQNSQAKNSASFVFVGALDYRANVQGVEWFCKYCWPLITAQRPDATLNLVGRSPVASVLQLAEIHGVSVVGEVPDVRPFLRDSTIAIAPLLTARGIQNKVLEAMAMGKPVVASPQAIEGIDCVIGKHLLKAVSPEEWSESLLGLSSDVEAQESLAIAARSFVEQKFSWEARLEPLNGLLGLSNNISSSVAEVKANTSSMTAAGQIA